MSLSDETEEFLPSHLNDRERAALSDRCANSSSEKGGLKCTGAPVPGHIYCYPCYIAHGGYPRK